mmetsp:Transcript_102438/g.221127  ORF Transcript_102438/g.221127 Transcript_102438/m.221127 type:complete len:258 (+) Transcript_102438:1862-2635(+)
MSVCRTSRAERRRSSLSPALAAACSAFSRYSSAVMPSRPRAKSRRTHTRAGRFDSLPGSSMFSPKRQAGASVLKRSSLRMPFELSTTTEESSAQSVMRCMSWDASWDLPAKPSQSMKASSGLRSSSSSREPQIQSPLVPGCSALPTRYEASPCCVRSRRRFRSRLLPVWPGPQTEVTAMRREPCRSRAAAPSAQSSYFLAPSPPFTTLRSCTGSSSPAAARRPVPSLGGSRSGRSSSCSSSGRRILSAATWGLQSRS